MAGFSKLYVIGGLRGHMGADGVNPIEFMILVGNADRQWLEARYMDPAFKPMGRLRVIVPARPDQPDALLDACIAFAPQYFETCLSLVQVKAAVLDTERLDFDAGAQQIPEDWSRLREEGRPIFAAMSIWQAEFVPLERM